MRIFVDEEGLDWDAAWSHHRAHLRLHQPHAAARGAGALAGAAVRAPAAAAPADHLRDQPALPAPGAHPVAGRHRAAGARCRSSRRATPKQVRMAHLATVGSHSVNGVAQLHTDLVKRDLLADFYELCPERFNNKTNGVSPRRWLLYSNPRLTHLHQLAHRLRLDRHATCASCAQLAQLADDTPFLEALASVKRANKRDLAALVAAPDRGRAAARGDVRGAGQAHPRVQAPAARLPAGDLPLPASSSATPTRTSCRAPTCSPARPPPGYAMAKLHIQLINDVAAVINSDPVVQRPAGDGVPAQLRRLARPGIIPAADLSVQISTAGKEASGTSNMKFALNGALTIGTLDGANVEIRDEVGPRELLPVRADGATRWRGRVSAGLRPGSGHRRAAPSWPRCWR